MLEEIDSENPTLEVTAMICFSHIESRKLIGTDKPRGTYERQGCFQCNGEARDCNCYIPTVVKYRMTQNTKPYEDSMRRKK